MFSLVETSPCERWTSVWRAPNVRFPFNGVFQPISTSALLPRCHWGAAHGEDDAEDAPAGIDRCFQIAAHLRFAGRAAAAGDGHLLHAQAFAGSPGDHLGWPAVGHFIHPEIEQILAADRPVRTEIGDPHPVEPPDYLAGDAIPEALRKRKRAWLGVTKHS